MFNFIYFCYYYDYLFCSDMCQFIQNCILKGILDMLYVLRKLNILQGLVFYFYFVFCWKYLKDNYFQILWIILLYYIVDFRVIYICRLIVCLFVY